VKLDNVGDAKINRLSGIWDGSLREDIEVFGRGEPVVQNFIVEWVIL